MRLHPWIGSMVLTGFAAVALVSSGCGQKDTTVAKAKDAKETKIDLAKGDHGWWCQEHGIVEADCSLCLPADVVKKRFKDTGDWCKEHERAKSQCFLCDPDLYEKVWEPKHVAKYGKKPERPPEEEFKKK